MTVSVPIVIIASILFSLLFFYSVLSLIIIAGLGYFAYNTLTRANDLAAQIDDFDSERVRLDNLDHINRTIVEFTVYLKNLLELDPFVESPELKELYSRAEMTLDLIYEYSNIYSDLELTE